MKFGEDKIPGDVPHPGAWGEVDKGTTVLLAEYPYPSAAFSYCYTAYHLLTTGGFSNTHSTPQPSAPLHIVFEFVSGNYTYITTITVDRVNKVF